MISCKKLPANWRNLKILIFLILFHAHSVEMWIDFSVINLNGVDRFYVLSRLGSFNVMWVA